MAAGPVQHSSSGQWGKQCGRGMQGSRKRRRSLSMKKTARMVANLLVSRVRVDCQSGMGERSQSVYIGDELPPVPPS